jgi:RHS repeat-associated protein
VQGDLRTAIDACCTAIRAAADSRFKHNPHGFGALVDGFKNFVKDHVADLAKLSGVLKLVSGIAGVLSFIPVIGEVAAPIALITAGAALAIDASIKFATGKGSWTSIAVDGALLALPFGLGKASEALRGMRGTAELAPALAGGERGLTGVERAASDLADEESAARTSVGTVDSSGRPLSERTCEADPVDVATGQVVLGQVDVRLPGVLPLVLARTHVSTYRAGRWFGPSWASTLDQRVEIDADGACYTSPDGMVLAYPPVPAGPHPVLPLAGPRRPLSASGDGYCITDEETGQRLHFAPVLGRPRQVYPLVAITDRNGNRIEIDHDASGAPRQIRHRGGYQVRVETAGGRIAALHLLGAGTEVTLIRYGYDAAGHLAEVTNSSGLPLRFGYDRDGRLHTWTDRNGVSYRYDYDRAGRCVRTEGSGGMLTADFHYHAEPRVTTVVQAAGHRTTYHLNATGRVISVTDALGNTTRSRWDDADRLVARTDPLGRTTGWEYDANGNVVAITRPDGSRLTATYNDFRQPLLTSGPDGATWQRGYDERGNLVSVTDPLGATITYGYDEAGHLVSATDALGDTRGIQTNPAGLPVAVTEPTGGTTTYRYDAFGQAVAATDALDNTTGFAYSVEGKLISRTRPDGATERWRYDGEGNLVEHVDATGQATRIEIGGFDLPAARTGPDGARLEFRYDAELRLTAVTNPQGLVWRYDYDPAGQLVRETDFNGRVIDYGYDGAGQLTQRRAGESATQFGYDLLGNLIQRESADGVASFGYDQAGRLAYARNADAEISYRRDALGRVLAETCNGRTVRTAYDRLGRRVSRVTPSGAASQWDYNVGDRPAALHAGGHSMLFGYDSAGREVQRHLDGAAVLAQTWDAASRLLSQTALPGAAGPAQHRAYRYRADGALVGVEDRLNGNRSFDLDPLGRVTAVRAVGWTERYAYDAAGNITDAAWPAAEPDAPVGRREYTGTLIRRAGNIRYQHDRHGRVVLRQQRRLSGKPRTWRYTWDSEDRLVSVTTPDGQRWRYRYDALGRRIAKQRMAADGTVVEQIDFTWDGPVLAEQVQHTGTTTTWDWAPGEFRPVTQREQVSAADAPQAVIDERFYAIVTDLVGTPTELVSAGGEVAWHARTALWGATTTVVPGDVNCPLCFPGQYHDPESGLNYNLHRHYDPATARYHSPDPLGLAGSPNPHTYVPNPTTWTDPLGLTPCNGMDKRPGAEVVPYSPQTASRTLLSQVGDGYATTPGGRTVSAHAADRIVNGAAGRPPTTLERVDDVLDHPDGLRYDPVRDTVRVNQDKSFVVVSGTGPGQHIVTVMIP